MGSTQRRVRAITGRARLLLALEAGALRYPTPLRWRSVRSIPARWLAALGGRRSTNWLGRPLAYEVRFESVLMHVHQSLALEMLARMGLPASATVLDVGGNIGQFGTAMITARPDIHLISLEPNPACRAILETNAENHSGWTVLPYGLSSQPGTAHFWFVPGRSGQGSVHRENAHANVIGASDSSVVQTDVEFISAEQLQQLIRETFAHFDLVKVDVEGHERMVLPEVAQLNWRYLLIEVGEGREGGVSAQDAAEILAERGVRVVQIASTADGSEPTYDVLFERQIVS